MALISDDQFDVKPPVLLSHMACIHLKPKKPPILPTPRVALTNILSLGTPKDRAVSDMAIVAFWGMAKIGE
ncbi:hypothetical protein MJO28_015795 [Puccinia striiformis f. sp. tritici]|uniref:Uncharacterized protein n=1 Tax=Puccinia striiformis f. sp. tritici TaxID=168172 RepID=A0ACC0DPP3_9BASI|nr:hypothetical protein MJO29_015599 [Puccinia striiformis f. sp. tritici]KAI7936896.1 hypothetical protein MJO28_015795 [Puccinia striiformis f. sp. tritici]